MNALPSQHSFETITHPVNQVYNFNCHGQIEQSAIYLNVSFECVNENSPAIILSSQCDLMPHSPQSYILLARLVPVAEIFLYWLESMNDYSEDEIFGNIPIASNKKKRKGIILDFCKMYLRGHTFGYYYLPEIEGKIEHSLVCFEITKCVSMQEIDDKEKLCVLKSPFREAVPARFAAYMGRIGTPQYQEEYLRTLMDNICQMKDS